MVDGRVPEMGRFTDQNEDDVECAEEEKEVDEKFESQAPIVDDQKEGDEENDDATNDADNQVMEKIQIEDQPLFCSWLSPVVLPGIAQPGEYLRR